MKLKEKLTKFCASTSGKVTGAVASAAAVLAPASRAFCAEGDTDFVTGIRSIWTQITQQVNIINIVAIIGIALATCLGLALFWFGARWVLRKIMGAAKRGKVSV